MTDEANLTGEYIVPLIEALDAYVPADTNRLEPYEWQDWTPYSELRTRLANLVDMNLRDGGWVRSLLMVERHAMADALSAKMFALMKDPQVTRRQFREELGRAPCESQSFQFFVPGKPVTVSHYHGPRRKLEL